MNKQMIKKIGLIAGEGSLPLHVAQNALQDGASVTAFSLSRSNRSQLKKICNGNLHPISPGLIQNTLALLQKESIRDIVFAGKVNKWVLLKDPRLDSMAIQALQEVKRLNDDAIMLWIVEHLETQGFRVLNQTDYLKDHFVQEAILTHKKPSPKIMEDIRYGFQLAREMGRLDIGQTVVIKDKMAIAVEAIEGTDQCLKRSGQWTQKKGGAVIKVAKPDQDKRFDVPTVGLATLKTMKKAGLTTLATEAGNTFFIDLEPMIAFANRHNLCIISVSEASLNLS